MRAAIRTVLQIVRKEFYQIRQDKRMLAVSVMAPLLQVLLLGYAATTDVRYTEAAFCDLDRSSLSREFIRKFTTTGYFLPSYMVDSPSEIDVLIEHGSASVGFVLPPDFSRKLDAGENVAIQMVVDGSDANTANVLIGYANQIVGGYSARVLLEQSMRRGIDRPPVIRPEPRVWFNPELVSRNFMVPGVLALVLMIITMTLTSLAIVKEKEIGTLEQLMVSPIRPVELILGKLIPFVVIGAADVLIVLSIAIFWFEVPFRGSMPVLIGLSGLFLMTTLGLGLFVSTISRSQQQAMLIAQFFFFMPFTFLSGFAFPIPNMPEIIQAITYVIPLRYYLEIVRGVFLKGVGLNELWPQAAALLGFGVLILSLSVARFKRTIM